MARRLFDFFRQRWKLTDFWTSRPRNHSSRKNLSLEIAHNLLFGSEENQEGESQPWWCVFISRSDRSPPPRRPRSFSGRTMGDGGWPRPGRPEVPTGRRTRNSDCTIRLSNGSQSTCTQRPFGAPKCRWIPRPYHAVQPTGIGPQSILWCLVGLVYVERLPEHGGREGRT